MIGFTLAARIYCSQGSPLPRNTVETIVIDVAYAAYDSASNGNKNRGSVRKALEM